MVRKFERRRPLCPDVTTLSEPEVLEETGWSPAQLELLVEKRVIFRWPAGWPDEVDGPSTYLRSNVYQVMSRGVPRAFVRGETPPQQNIYCYFIGSGDGPIKIGSSSKPVERLRSLQTAHPHPLRILAVALGVELESAYHARFARWRLHGEWFERSADILDEIEAINRRLPHSDKTGNHLIPKGRSKREQKDFCQ